MVRRVEDWPERLDAFVRAARRKPFVYGQWDCALMAAAWVMECTGVDVAAKWRGYTDEPDALRVVCGAGGLAAIVTEVLGEALPTPALAQRGDIVLIARDVPEPWNAALGVCAGTHGAFASRKGVALAPMASWSSAWRVG